jgi:hypothetical protein
MLKLGLGIFLLVLLTTGAMAQQQSDHFLAEVFAINSFKMNSTLQDVQGDKQLAENLSFFDKTDNRAIYQLTGPQINLPGLSSLDRLAFDTVYLTFENNKLHDVDLYVPGSFKDKMFVKTCDKFNAQYGQFVMVDQKNSKDKKYVWNSGTKELSLRPGAGGIIVHYASKISDKKIGWIYTDRKGNGNGTIQLNLPYFEKLLDLKLTIGSFEKVLPQWETTGTLNHVFYEYNFKTRKEDEPRLSITYSLKNYNIMIQTEDTTSKIISEFMLEKITDAGVLEKFEKDLNNGQYKKRLRRNGSRSVSYSNDKYLILLDKQDSRITILRELGISELLNSFAK